MSGPLRNLPSLPLVLNVVAALFSMVFLVPLMPYSGDSNIETSVNSFVVVSKLFRDSVLKLTLKEKEYFAHY